MCFWVVRKFIGVFVYDCMGAALFAVFKIAVWVAFGLGFQYSERMVDSGVG